MQPLQRTILITLFICLLSKGAFAQHWQWVKSAGGIGTDEGFGITADATGHSYITGYYDLPMTLGAFTLTSAGGRDIFLAKYDPAGEVVWAKRAGGPKYDSGYKIAVDAIGQVYITGRIDGTEIFGEKSDLFISKYDPDGNLIWSQSAGGPRTDFGSDIAVDATGNIYVTGRYEGSIKIGDFTLPDKSTSSLFIVKLDPAGKVLWAQRSGGTPATYYNGLGLDTIGNIYVTGSFKDSTSIGNFTLTGNSDDIFLAKYDPSGNVLWVKAAGGTSWDYGSNIAVDARGNSFITGIFYSKTAKFGAVTLTKSGDDPLTPDIFTAKYDPDGNLIWANKAGGADYDIGNDIAVDKAGNSFITGAFFGPSSFGSTTLNTGHNTDIFIASYSPGGDLNWVKQAGSSDYDFGLGIALDPNGNGYIIGTFSNTASFDNFEITYSDNSLDVCIAKFGPNPVPEEELFIPNIITPNGDGVNDTFGPHIPGDKAVELKIYTRWGKLVYEQEKYRNTWNGDKLPAGTYYFLLTSGTGKAWKGWIEISR